jgi:tetratricopeptide (TPR) repeat protein
LGDGSQQPGEGRRRSQLRLSPEEAVDFAADLAQRRAAALVEAGHYEEAIGVYDEEARSYRALLGGATGRAPDPETARRQSMHLGKVLMEIGTLHARLRRTEPALAHTEEALGVVRGLGPIDSMMFGYVLSRVLWGYAWVRAGLGVDLRPALGAVQEAEAILSRLAEDPPASLAPTVQAELPVLQSFLAHLQGRIARTEQYRPGPGQ